MQKRPPGRVSLTIGKHGNYERKAVKPQAERGRIRHRMGCANSLTWETLFRAAARPSRLRFVGGRQHVVGIAVVKPAATSNNASTARPRVRRKRLPCHTLNSSRSGKNPSAGSQKLDTLQSSPLHVAESNESIMNTTVKWAAVLDHVREVSLFGTADLSFWTDWLRSEDLQPAECDGQAQLMIVAADEKYMALRFQELSFSIVVRPPEPSTQQNAAYLVGAFNSRWLFAFGERVLFSTPYEYGRVAVSTARPVAIDLVIDRHVAFKAEMGEGDSSADRQPSNCTNDGWEGPVFLPRSRRKRAPGKFFYARLRGLTKTYPFLPSIDWLTIASAPDRPVLQALRDSHFVAKEWVIRDDAVHGKSKSYKRRSELL
jgi:hypothetical protein